MKSSTRTGWCFLVGGLVLSGELEVIEKLLAFALTSVRRRKRKREKTAKSAKCKALTLVSDWKMRSDKCVYWKRQRRRWSWWGRKELNVHRSAMLVVVFCEQQYKRWLSTLSSFQLFLLLVQKSELLFAECCWWCAPSGDVGTLRGGGGGCGGDGDGDCGDSGTERLLAITILINTATTTNCTVHWWLVTGQTSEVKQLWNWIAIAGNWKRGTQKSKCVSVLTSSSVVNWQTVNVCLGISCLQFFGLFELVCVCRAWLCLLQVAKVCVWLTPGNLMQEHAGEHQSDTTWNWTQMVIRGWRREVKIREMGIVIVRKNKDAPWMSTGLFSMSSICRALPLPLSHDQRVGTELDAETKLLSKPNKSKHSSQTRFHRFSLDL